MRRTAAAMLAWSAILTATAVGDEPSVTAGEEQFSDLGEKLSSTPAPIDAPHGCPAEMVEIVGDYCPAVEQFCAEYIDQKSIARDRCALFRPTGRCFGKTEAKHFCIDRYEWPNRAGGKPDIGMNWEEAKSKCEGAGKRLCKETEWTLACEGQERLPYPYGYARNTRACNIDRPYILPDLDKFGDSRRDARVRAARSARSVGRARIVRQPVWRLRHDGERRRVGDRSDGQREREAVQERAQGGLLGARAQPMPPRDHRSQSVAPRVRDRLSLL